MMRWLATLLLVLLPGLAAAQGFVGNELQKALSGPGRTVSVTGFSGALSSKAQVQELTIADAKGVWLTLKGVTLDWNRLALLSGKVEVRELAADEIDVARLPESPPAQAPSPEASGFSLPSLPVSIDIGKIEAKRVSLGAPVLGQPAVLAVSGAMKLAGGEGSATLQVRRIDGPEGVISLDASYANKTRQLNLNLEAKEAAHGLVGTLIGLPGAPALDLTVKGAGPIDSYAADIALSTDGQPRLKGTVKVAAPAPVNGTPQGRTFSAQVAGDIAPLFAPQYQGFFGPNIRLNVDGTQGADGTLTLSTLELAAQSLQLAGQVTIGADGLPRLIDLQGRVGSVGGVPVLLPLPGNPTKIGGAVVAMAYDASRGDGWTAKVALNGLDRAEFSAGSLLLDGKGTIDPKAKVVDGTLNLSGEGLRPAQAALARALGTALSGTIGFAWHQGGALELPQIALSGAGIDLNASGKVEGLDAALQVSGKATARASDLGRFSALAGRSLGGSGTVSVDGSAALLAGSFDASVTVDGQNLSAGQPQLDSLLKGPSHITLSAKRDATGTTIRNLDLKARTLTAQAQGSIRTGGTDLTASARFSDLSALGSGYGGSWQAQGHYSEQGGLGKISLDGNGTDIRIGQPQADGLLKGHSVLTLRATRQGDAITVQTATLDNPQLTADLSGLVQQDASDLSAHLSLHDLAAVGHGFGGSMQAAATLKQANGTDRVTLQGTAQDLSLGQPMADKLLRGKTSVDIAAARKGTAITVDRLTVSNPQLSLKGNVAPSTDGQTLTLDARLANLALVAPGFPGAVSARGTVTQSPKGYALDLKAQGPAALNASVSGSVAADFSTANVTAQGTLESAIANGMIAPQSVRGPVHFDLHLNGAPSLAAVSGQLKLGPARLAVPDAGIVAQPLNATVSLSGGRAQVDVNASVGGGTLAVQGPVTLSAPYNADLSIRLAHLGLKNPDLYSTHVDGALTMQGALTGGARIAGRLALGSTELRVPSTGLGGTAAIPNLKLVGATPQQRATRTRAGLKPKAVAAKPPAAHPYPLDITILAPNQIFIRGRGLNAELGGQVRLTGTSANVVPIGGFRLLRGYLDLLGKRFDLANATLSLEGQLVPFVNIVANSVNDNVTSTITISGEATDPKITFSSNPPLPQEEVLSQLFFGHGLSKISPFQAAQLASAVATLAGTGGEGIIGKLRQGFGLDNLDFATSATGGTEVKAGKYLSKNLYTEVTVGSEGKTAISLNLDVTKSVTVKGTAGSEGSTGIGVYYQHDY